MARCSLIWETVEGTRGSWDTLGFEVVTGEGAQHWPL